MHNLVATGGAITVSVGLLLLLMIVGVVIGLLCNAVALRKVTPVAREQPESEGVNLTVLPATRSTYRSLEEIENTVYEHIRDVDVEDEDQFAHGVSLEPTCEIGDSMYVRVI